MYLRNLAKQAGCPANLSGCEGIGTCWPHCRKRRHCSGLESSTRARWMPSRCGLSIRKPCRAIRSFEFTRHNIMKWALTILLTIVTSATAEDWPGFRRDPALNGVALAAKIPSDRNCSGRSRQPTESSRPRSLSASMSMSARSPEICSA